MNKHTVLAGLLALVSFNLVACAEPESAEDSSESAIATTVDRAVVDIRKPMAADALLASSKEMKAGDALDPSLITTTSPAYRSGGATASPRDLGLAGTLNDPCSIRALCNPGWPEQQREEPVDLQKDQKKAELVEGALAEALTIGGERKD